MPYPLAWAFAMNATRIGRVLSYAWTLGSKSPGLSDIAAHAFALLHRIGLTTEPSGASQDGLSVVPDIVIISPKGLRTIFEDAPKWKSIDKCRLRLKRRRRWRANKLLSPLYPYDLALLRQQQQQHAARQKVLREKEREARLEQKLRMDRKREAREMRKALGRWGKRYAVGS